MAFGCKGGEDEGLDDVSEPPACSREMRNIGMSAVGIRHAQLRADGRDKFNGQIGEPNNHDASRPGPR